MNTDAPHFYEVFEAYETGHLDVGDGHRVYFELSGNPEGEPVIMLHGMAGGGLSHSKRRLFDPRRYRLIQFDQRGCGNSLCERPYEANTTSHLHDDINSLLDHANAPKAHIYGCSWGSTLALSYADRFPERIKSLTVNGIFLCRDHEIHYTFDPHGIAARLYGEEFAKFLTPLPVSARQDPYSGYLTLFRDADKETCLKAALIYEAWKVHIISLRPPVYGEEFQPRPAEIGLNDILRSLHFIKENGFLDGDKLIKQIGEKLTNIPVHILHGRYDLICPVSTAFELYKAIPHAELSIIPDAGHRTSEASMMAALLGIFDRLAK